MAFIRQKKVHGYRYYQVVRNYREGGRHRQKVLCHLGKYNSLEAAIEGVKQQIAFHQREAIAKQRNANRVWEQLIDLYFPFLESDPNLFTAQEAYEELVGMRRGNPFRSDTYPDTDTYDSDFVAEWYSSKEEWEIRQRGLEMYVSYDDTLREAIQHQRRASNHLQKRLDKLLECQQKHFGNRQDTLKHN